MTDCATNFSELSASAVAALAASRARALGLMLTPERLAEAAENLAIIQDHARIFLASPLAAEAAQDGED